MIHFLLFDSFLPSALANLHSNRRTPGRFHRVFLAGCLLLITGFSAAHAQAVKTETCNNAEHILPAGDMNTDLVINGITCTADGKVSSGGQNGIYVYRNVNILNHGTLTFDDAPIDFHAHAILVEMLGTLQAGATSPIKGPLTFWLWGAKSDDVPSITCKSDTKNQCGVPDSIWTSNPNVSMKIMPTMACTPAMLDGKYLLPNKDCFYPYEILDAGDPAGSYFGRKVLAVSAGGTLMLRGAKGIREGTIETAPADSGTSWGRLTKTLNGGEDSIYIDRPVPTWGKGDHIVVTTTDYLPGHTEELIIKQVVKDQTGYRIDLDVTKNIIRYPHYGQTYDYSSIVTDHASAGLPAVGPIPDPNVTNLKPHNIETRAIIALLSRSITVASEGATPTVERTAVHFPETPGNFFGGHTLAREGFNTFEVQGVEFLQLGQGGIIGHYPIHFHMARSVPQPDPATNFLGTYAADCSIVDSMTRFITVHATQGVTLARNVGYHSIGHGFYLEDATETNNRIYSNVGINVEGALANTATNPRMTPGILDLPAAQVPNPPGPGYPGQQVPDAPPFTSDITTPSTFWIMNTWNDFEYNAAVGAGACGACYWMPPGGISGPSRYEAWTGYAGMQRNLGLFGAVPLMTFKGNSCSAAMAAIVTIGQSAVCNGVNYGPGESTPTQFAAVANPSSVPVDGYPQVSFGQRAKPTLCTDLSSDCTNVLPCSGFGPALQNCDATIIDHFTTSFNWAPLNFAAIWLRGWWFLLENSAITDVQNGGLTFISGGGYSRSDAAQGFWSVLKDSVLVGNTQPLQPDSLPLNPFASNAGPFNPKGLPCAYTTSHCLSQADGIVFVASNLGVNQKLFNIYDGPAAQLNNIYSDVHETVLGTLAACKPDNSQPGACATLKWMNGFLQGVLQSPPGDKTANNCVLPNAAIGWKQPNGFYYPPAFNSENLVFKDVDIRHFVIQPLYLPGSFNEDTAAIQKTYCSWNPGMFSSNFTDIDRETELSDQDGSLTGLTSEITYNSPTAYSTTSITKDPYFVAPLLTDECASGQGGTDKTTGPGATVDTSPYEYLSTAVVAECGIQDASCTIDKQPYWISQCTTPACYGVPLFRQSVTYAEEQSNLHPSIRLMGQANAQRSSLTVNHAHYYVDTSLSLAGQQGTGAAFWTVFLPNQNYDFFFLFANEKTKQTYQIYIGPGLTQPEAQATLTLGRMPIPDNSFPWTTKFNNGGNWATFGGYDAVAGILTVNVNLAGLTELDPANRSAFCQPASYCSWNASTKACGCAAGSACAAQGNDDVCAAATKDLDCPVDGCYGFQIKMPSSFTTSDTAKAPPATVRYESVDPYFAGPTNAVVTFAGAAQKVASDCYYDPVPLQPVVPPPSKSHLNLTPTVNLSGGGQ